MKHVTCSNCKKDFIIEPDDFAFYEKIAVPPPTHCPECRAIRRLAWRNERYFYKRKCDATGKDVFTYFHPDAPVKVYDRDYWWSDAWDAMEYGRDYDFSRPFFEQFKELLYEVPHFSRSVINLQNSDYCMNCADVKNCYMLFNGSKNESCMYCNVTTKSRDCIDCTSIASCELCYECTLCSGCFRCFFCVDCDNSRDSFFLKDCNNCSDCFGCVGLRNKQYYIFNEPYSKEEYQQRLSKLLPSSRSLIADHIAKRDALALTLPVRSTRGLQNLNSEGEYLYNCKNVRKSYEVHGAEDSKFCQMVINQPSIRDCYDYSIVGMGAETMYEDLGCGLGSSHVFFSIWMYPDVQRAEYSFACSSSKDIFGCVGLRKMQYCIFNKQYTPEEYDQLVAKIKANMMRDKEYGEFFPTSMSMYGYNETIAQDFFPKTKDEALAQKFLWRDPLLKKYEITKSWRDLPDSILDVSDEILKENILCRAWDESEIRAQEHGCTKVFRITPQELLFYRANKISLPQKCFYSRCKDRYQYKQKMALYRRACAKCNAEIQTSYSPDRPEIVYCEQCYNKEIL